MMQIPLFEVAVPNKPKANPPKPSRLLVSIAPTTTTPAQTSRPQTLIQHVVEVLGAIDLDPYGISADVPAKQRYSAEKSGLKETWRGRVWLNPPTNRSIESWVEKLAHEYEDGEVTAAIALLPARTNTRWWQRCLANYPYCAIEGKVEYVRPDGKRTASSTASAAVYLGPQLSRFGQVFSSIGTVYIPYIR